MNYIWMTIDQPQHESRDITTKFLVFCTGEINTRTALEASVLIRKFHNLNKKRFYEKIWREFRGLTNDARFFFSNKVKSSSHSRSQGDPGGHAPTKFLAYTVILCFKMRYPKQNSVIRLKSDILPTPQIFCPPKF